MAGFNSKVSAKSVGLEISRNVVRACVLGIDGALIDYAEAPRLSSQNPDSLVGVDSTIRILWGELRLGRDVNVGVSVGSRFSGVGSGPEMHGWLDSLEAKIGQKVARVGTPNSGISYAPLLYIQEVKSLFVDVVNSVSLVEVAPISVARVLGYSMKASYEFSSSVAWRARVHSGVVLEAVASRHGSSTSFVQVTSTDGVARPIANLSGYYLDEKILAQHSLTLSKLAVSLGAAIGARADRKLSDLGRIIDIRQAEQNALGPTYVSTTSDVPVEVIDLDEPVQAGELAPAMPPQSNAWPVSGEVQAIASPVQLAPLPEYGAPNATPDVAFIDLTGDSDLAAPSVPPASNMLPTYADVLRMPPMPAESTRLDNPVLSPEMLAAAATKRSKTLNPMTLVNTVSEDSIVKVLVWLVAGVIGLFLLLILFG